jgi:molecular chaperone DnaJ
MANAQRDCGYDLYAVLGLAEGASASEVHRAYLELARKYHPALNPGDPEAEERFKLLSVAHEVLTDPEKRKVYDEFGIAGLKAGFDPRRARAIRPATAGRRKQGREAAADRGRGFSVDEIVNEIFAGLSGKRLHGRDIEQSLSISMLESVRGTTKTIKVARRVWCRRCRGNGSVLEEGIPCSSCLGSGRVKVGPAAIGLARRCPKCRGLGTVRAPKCRACEGQGNVAVSEKLAVKVPAGVIDGRRLRVCGKGQDRSPGREPGDLFITVRVRPHPLLKREGLDLLLDLPVTVKEAVVGASVRIPTPDGEVSLKIPRGSQSGRRFRLRGKGMSDPAAGKRGDLYVRVLVHVPKQCDAKLEQALEIVEKSYTESPRSDLLL